MNADQKARWRLFYLQEQALFNFLNEHATCLYTAGEERLGYRYYTTDTGGTLEKAPRFLHWIGRLTVPEGEFLERVKVLQMYYISAAGKTFRRLPVRFPVFYRNVEQINISQHTAWSSRRVDGETVTLGTYATAEDAQPDMARLAAAGFRPQLVNDVLFLALVVSTAEFCAYAGSQDIRARKLTGTQYRAVVRHTGQSAGVRCKLGLMVLDQASGAMVVQAPKQAPRPHSLVATGSEIQLPDGIDTGFRFYRL